MFNSLQLTGQTAAHVRDSAALGCTLHPQTAQALLVMREAARSQGIELAVVSAFRDFERQSAIWDAKFRGERPVLDRDGRPLEWPGLPEAQRVAAILQWSALPGASRHHWGTDFDVIDTRAVTEGYRPQLVSAEFGEGGVFAKLDAWLAEHAGQFGFFRPYSTDRGGVLPEPWHLSYAPASVPALESLTLELLSQTLGASTLCGRECVLELLPEIYRRYVKDVDAVEALPPVLLPTSPGF